MRKSKKIKEDYKKCNHPFQETEKKQNYKRRSNLNQIK